MTSRLALSLGALLLVVGCRKKQVEPAPVATATAEAVITTPSGVVIANMSKDLQRCWDAERASANPPSSAAGVLTLKVEPNGVVSTATADGIDRPSLASCLEGVGKATKFAPVEPPGASLKVPINF